MIFYRAYPIAHPSPYPTPNTVYVTSTFAGALYWGELLAKQAWIKHSELEDDMDEDNIYFAVTEIDIPEETAAWYSHTTWADECPIKAPMPIGEIKKIPMTQQSQIWLDGCSHPQYPTKKLGIGNSAGFVFDKNPEMKVYIDILREFRLAIYRALEFEKIYTESFTHSENATPQMIDFLNALNRVKVVDSMFQTFLERKYIANAMKQYDFLQTLPIFCSCAKILADSIANWLNRNSMKCQSILYAASISQEYCTERVAIEIQAMYSDAVNILDFTRETVAVSYGEYRLLISS